MIVRGVIKSLFIATLFSVFANCTGHRKEASAEPEAGHEDPHPEVHQASVNDTARPAVSARHQVDVTFQQQLSDVFTAYIELKEALVDSDPIRAKEAAAYTLSTLKKVDKTALSESPRLEWMEYVSPMTTSLRQIQSSSEMEEQRKSFRALSEALYKSIRAFGLGGNEAFYEFCPMAFNNEGAYWLSNEENIRNPYFGDRMLTCGNVEERLK